MKRTAAVVTIILFVIFFVSCSVDSLESYNKAVQKTEDIKTGQTSGNFTVVMDFNTEGMTEEQIKELNYFKTVEGSFNAAYDESQKAAIIRNYLNLGGLGFDYDIYMNEDKMFMKLPIVGKYLQLDESYKNGEATVLISEDTKASIGEKWMGLLNKEDIFREKDIILTTPDGEVKTTQYTIALKDEQIKSLAFDGMEILLKDEKFKESYENLLKKNIKYFEGYSLDKLTEAFEETLKNCKVEAFAYNAYVDIDGYIVNETIEISVTMQDSNSSGINGFDYKMEIKNWDINKAQDLEFPILSEENTLKLENIEKNMPSVFEGMFSKEN